MPNVEALNDSLRGFFRTLLGWPAHSIRPANQLAPTGLPADVFATVLIASLAPVVDPVLGAVAAWKDVPTPSTDVEETVYVTYRGMASVNFYRGDAQMNASRLAIRLQSTGAIETLQKMDLGLISCSGIRNLAGIDEAVWESRAQLDIMFAVLAYEALTVATYNQFRFEIATEEATSIKEITIP